MKSSESVNSKNNNFLNLVITNWESLEESQNLQITEVPQ